MKTSIALALVWFIGPCTPSSDCWDPNADAVCDPSEDLNGDGTCDVLDCAGSAGVDGMDGADGIDGLNCWDLDDSGACDGAEDRDGSGTCDADDCQGDPGPLGDAGPAGTQGDAGPAGTSCTVSPTATGALITCDDGTNTAIDHGAEGPEGLGGPPGLTGQDGTRCTVVDNGGSATISCDDGSSATVSNGRDGTSGGATGVREVVDGDLLTVSDVNLHLTGGGTLTLPDAAPDGTVLRVAFDGGQALTFAGVANRVVGIGAAATGTTYDVVSADPALITLLFVQGQNRWYVNAL